MQDLKEHAFKDESRSHHDLLSTCQVTLSHTPQPLRGAMATSYHLLLGQALPSPPSVPPQKATPVEEQPPMATPLAPMPKQSPRPKNWLPLPEPMGSMPMDGATPKATQGGPPSPKKWETPLWFQSLKPSCAGAFQRDSDIVIEARLHFFSKHSYNFTGYDTWDLSTVFKKLGISAGLLGTEIHEIQSSWTEPEELK